MVAVTRRHDAAQYDGTNGNYLIGEWNTTCRFISDQDGILTYLNADGEEITARAGDWLIQTHTADRWPYPEASERFANIWRPIAEAPDEPAQPEG